ncbi:MAG: autotransporter outer membrane beta-barrel domain-containing protein [Pseudomonadota bacterium]
MATETNSAPATIFDVPFVKTSFDNVAIKSDTDYAIYASAESGFGFLKLSQSDLYNDGGETRFRRSDGRYAHSPDTQDLIFEFVFALPQTASQTPDFSVASSNASRLMVRNSQGILRARGQQSLATRNASLSLGTVTTTDGSRAVTVSTRGAEEGLINNVHSWIEFTGFYAEDSDADRWYRGLGFQLGADIPVGPNMVAGLSLGVEDITTSFGTLNQEGNMTFVQPYVAYRNGPFSGEASLLYGSGDFDLTSSVGTGKSDTELRALTVSGAYDIALGRGVLTPMASLVVGQEKSKSSGSTGTGRETVDFRQPSIGVRYSDQFAKGSYFVGLQADFLDTDGNTQAVRDLLSDDGWTGRVEAGASMSLGRGVGLETSIEVGGLGGDLIHTAGTIRLSFQF